MSKRFVYVSTAFLVCCCTAPPGGEEKAPEPQESRTIESGKRIQVRSYTVRDASEGDGTVLWFEYDTDVFVGAHGREEFKENYRELQREVEALWRDLRDEAEEIGVEKVFIIPHLAPPFEEGGYRRGDEMAMDSYVFAFHRSDEGWKIDGAFMYPPEIQ